MPQYTLRVVTNGVLTSTVYTLQITGSSSSAITVKYSATGSGPWTDFNPPGTATYNPANGGNGTPSNPQSGDVLTLTGTVAITGQTSYTLDGDATYDPPGNSATGYIRVPGTEAEEGDWQATSN
jgi:hypothetical protein